MRESLIALTFDDGFKTDLTVGVQEQLNRGWEVKGTSYIITSASTSGRLTPAEQLEMIDLGWDIQDHTHTHPISPNLTGHTPTQLRDEMTQVDTYFKDSLRLYPPEHLAYPGGGNNALVRNVIGRYRKTMRGTQAGFVTAHPDWQEIPSYNFEGPDQLQTVKDAIDIAVKYGLSMTVFTHELALPEKVEAYKQLLAYIEEKQIRPVTISEMHDILTSP